MSRRAIICISTAVVLFLAAACGFIFGNMTRSYEYDTERTDNSYEEIQEYSDNRIDGTERLSQANGGALEDGLSEQQEGTDNQENYEYIAQAQNGTVVVYHSDGETVFFDSGIEVLSLPDETIDKLLLGIGFESEEELFGFLESYSS